MDAGRPPTGIHGVVTRGPDGQCLSGGPGEWVGDLDTLPMPHTASHLFPPEWYDDTGLGSIPGGILTSRGCPARCAALTRTLRFMEEIAPLVDTFNTLGVVVPFPGTPLHDEHQAEYSLDRWWLDERCLNYEAPPSFEDLDGYRRHYVDDRNLDLDFFRCSDEMRDLIRECLRFKGEHNLKMMGLAAEEA